jgi:broad specificity phosphatase PhoE
MIKTKIGTNSIPGETEWTINGRYTSFTDLELTPAGIKQVTGTSSQLVGPGKLIKPSNITRIWVSPRTRAQQTFKLLFGTTESESGLTVDASKVTVTDDIAEWNYGEYEGLLAAEIRAGRKAKGLDKDSEWEIWRDGCEGGEYVVPC